MAFEKALELEPNQSDTLNELAICMMELSQYDEAKERLVAALQIEPENTKVISNLGVVAMRTGEPEEAAGYFRTVLEIDPEDRIASTFLQELEAE